MPVKKQTLPKRAGAKRKTSTPARRTVAQPVSVADMRLPDDYTEPSTRIEDYIILIYAPPKWGKTTLAASFPDPIFLMTEAGAKGLRIKKLRINTWPEMVHAVKLLTTDDRFQNVVTDTLDEAYRLCMEHVCKMAGVEHPHDADDYGKTWNKVADEFCRAFRVLDGTGRGLIMTSHEKESEIKSASGEKFTRISPTLAGGSAGKRVLALADFIFYGEHMRTARGKPIRVIRTRGNDLIVGGSRKIGGEVTLPLYIPLPDDESKDYEVLAAAFRGEDVGIDPKDLRVSAATSKAGAKQAKQDRTDALLKKGG